MMIYKISKPTKNLKGSVALTASKSESNRILIIQALCKDKFEIKNLADAQDTQTLRTILQLTTHPEYSGSRLKTSYDVGPAGTTMRFLTAYLSTLQRTITLTGSGRMHERPIRILVDALRQLGAKITYLEKEGFPPLSIEGNLLKGGEIEIEGNISSQYISALLLITPALFNGLIIKFKGAIVSRPYIDMTLKVMENFGIYGQWQENTISVSSQNYSLPEANYTYTVEADWSAASYWYAMAALSDEVDLHITGLRKNSLQGDAVIADLFSFFGVHTEYTADGVRLSKRKFLTQHFGFDFSDCPDIAQTIAVVVSALKIPSMLTGLQTLKIKETNRIEALCNELGKISISAKEAMPDVLEIQEFQDTLISPPTPLLTYNDHRMAMALTPLVMKLGELKIENPEVVKKSYPNFWEDLKSVGFLIEEL